MNILFFAPNYLPATRYGGPIRSSHGLCRALAARGHDVEVVTTNVDGPGTLDVSNGEQRQIDGVRVRYFAIRTPRRIYYAPNMRAYLEHRQEKPDVVHINGMYLWPGPALARAAEEMQVPYVVSPRGMLVPELIAGKSRMAKRAWINTFEKHSLAHAAAIHVTSEEEAMSVRRLRLDLAPISVIGNGVDPPRELPSEAESERFWRGVTAGQRVAFLGRLDWTKGVELAASAMSELPNATLLIAGPDQLGLQRTIEESLTSAGTQHRIRFLGPLDETAKWAFLAGADVLVVPSLKESFGLSAAEMLAIGGTVVCSEGVGASSIVRRIDPACVVARTPTAFAETIAAMLGDAERRAQFGSAARALMQMEFSWAAIVARMEALYERILEKQGAERRHASA